MLRREQDHGIDAIGRMIFFHVLIDHAVEDHHCICVFGAAHGAGRRVEGNVGQNTMAAEGVVASRNGDGRHREFLETYDAVFLVVDSFFLFKKSEFIDFGLKDGDDFGFGGVFDAEQFGDRSKYPVGETGVYFKQEFGRRMMIWILHLFFIHWFDLCCFEWFYTFAHLKRPL